MITDLWPYFAGFGFVAALVFNLRGIAILACALLAAAFAGLAISGLFDDRLPWIFGIALMASPLIGAIALPGVFLGWLAKLVFRKVAEESEQSSDDVD
ncbi:hypothetical protein J7J08_08420 [Stenotrophomonas sp. ISL-67]|uniref:hypothetical protein n=1 Tax=Stenotrophomonas sp. ISL-67 TaxID=2819171 RepID=UPI001BEBAD54|nr:hypothetical protein [Stenotrophomonas sp. ISL-67]MBT2767662.1 hypothetical protein [Stenotrophomonas sp. ISL-67]